MNTAINAASGLKPITTVSLSGASMYDITNCFSATYENYKIIYNSITSAAVALRINLLAGTTPATGADYRLGLAGVNESGGAANVNQVNGTYLHFCNTGSSLPTWTSVDCDIYKPFSAVATQFTFRTADTDGAYFYGRAGGGLHTLATSYSGIRFVSSGGNFSGTVRIYGYNN
jgi:hypothetical protein